MSWEHASDEELVEAYKQADPVTRRDLASVLFDRHYLRVARWCLRFAGDRDTAADLAQNVFVKAYRHLDGFQGASRFSTWLYAIARHECLGRLRTVRARPEDPDEEGLVDVPTPEADPEARLVQTSEGRYAHAILNATLEETERRVFALHYGNELPLDQITRLLKLTNASGAKAFIVSAKRKLARAVRRIEAKGGRL